MWVANSPDYGVGEVATHALGLALGVTRNIVAYHRDITARATWHYLSSGPLRRPRELTLGIVGLGRIGKRMAQISRDVFKRVVAYDPYLIDGDFPVFVERVATLEALAQAADVVSLHVPLTAETRGMIGERFFAALQAGQLPRQHRARRRRRRRRLPARARCWNSSPAPALDVLPAEPVAVDRTRGAASARGPHAARGVLFEGSRARAAPQGRAEPRDVDRDRAAGLRGDAREAASRPPDGCGLAGYEVRAPPRAPRAEHQDGAGGAPDGGVSASPRSRSSSAAPTSSAAWTSPSPTASSACSSARRAAASPRCCA